MREPPKPFEELSTEELAGWVDRLVDAADSTRLEINFALVEVDRRFDADPADDLDRLKDLRADLLLWLLRDSGQRMGWARDRGDRPPRSCGVCMCSATRLEPRIGGAG
jgi:hypothetical protein